MGEQSVAEQVVVQARPENLEAFTVTGLTALVPLTHQVDGYTWAVDGFNQQPNDLTGPMPSLAGELAALVAKLDRFDRTTGEYAGALRILDAAGLGGSLDFDLALGAWYTQVQAAGHDPDSWLARLQAHKAKIDQLRAQGVPPAQYQDELKQYWFEMACLRAGINPDSWKPEAGAGANHDTIFKVYAYYARLFLDHPYLQWPGMGNLVGPTFSAGFFDLDDIRNMAHAIKVWVETLPSGQRHLLPHEVEALVSLADMTEQDMHYFETTFLKMQQKIFGDQGGMHEAYLHGGTAATDELAAATVIDVKTATAWHQVDLARKNGDPQLLRAATKQFVDREQRDIITEDYDNMRNYGWPKGQGFTYLMTLVGQPSIPGTRPYAQVFPFTQTVAESPGPPSFGTNGWFGLPDFSIDNPTQGSVEVVTPFPSGNVSVKDDRWKLIEADTLPAYERLLTEHPDLVREMVAAPVEPRMQDYRMRNRLGEVIVNLMKWGFEAHQ